MTRECAAGLLAAPQFKRKLPEIIRILDLPLPIRMADGDIAYPRIGYDPRFRIYTDPGSPKIRPMSPDEAMEWLREAHDGFGWLDSQSLVHQIARVIPPHCRGLTGWDARFPAGHYSDRVTAASGSQVAVVANLYMGTHGVQTFNAFTTKSQKWVAPLFTSRLSNNLSTPVTVQNLSGNTIPAGGIQMSCKANPASTVSGDVNVSNTAAVNNTASYSFNPVVDQSIPAGFQGACTITTTGFATVAFVQLRFIGPAHVSPVIGSRPYEFFAEEYRKPVVIAGFEPLDVMQAILMLSLIHISEPTRPY